MAMARGLPGPRGTKMTSVSSHERSRQDAFRASSPMPSSFGTALASALLCCKRNGTSRYPCNFIPPKERRGPTRPVLCWAVVTNVLQRDRMTNKRMKLPSGSPGFVPVRAVSRVHSLKIRTHARRVHEASPAKRTRARRPQLGSCRHGLFTISAQSSGETPSLLTTRTSTSSVLHPKTITNTEKNAETTFVKKSAKLGHGTSVQRHPCQRGRRTTLLAPHSPMPRV